MPDGWTEERLGNVLKLKYGFALGAEERSGSGYPVLGSNGVVGHHREARVGGPGVVVGRKGSAGAVTWTDQPFWPIDTTYWVAPEPENDIHWIHEALTTARLDQLNSSTGVPGLNRGDAYQLTVARPPLEEQRRIAEVLDTIDDAICSTERIIAKSRLVHVGLLQAPAAAAIPRRLADIATLSAGSTPTRNDASYYGGGIPWVKSGEVDSPAIHTTEEAVTTSALRDFSMKLVASGTPLVAMYGATAGKVGWLATTACTNQAVLAVEATEPSVRPRWLYWQLVAYAPRLIAAVQGSGQPNLNKSIIGGLTLQVPARSEQQRSIGLLDASAAVIRREHDRLDKLRATRAGLAADLLSGRVRTVAP